MRTASCSLSRRGRLILFDDVDVNTQIEAAVGGQGMVKPLLIRSANHKSVEQLSSEIRTSQHQDPPSERRYRAALAFSACRDRCARWRGVSYWGIPNGQALRRHRRNQLCRDVGPAGGWGIPIAPPTLMITVGGIATKPCYVDGELQARELLDLTISVDHEVVDGAPAARSHDG